MMGAFVAGNAKFFEYISIRFNFVVDNNIILQIILYNHKLNIFIKFLLKIETKIQTLLNLNPHNLGILVYCNY